MFASLKRPIAAGNCFHDIMCFHPWSGPSAGMRVPGKIMLAPVSSLCVKLVQRYMPPLCHPYSTPMPPLCHPYATPYATPMPPLCHPMPPYATLCHPMPPPCAIPMPPLCHPMPPYATLCHPYATLCHPMPPLCHPYAIPMPPVYGQYCFSHICLSLLFKNFLQ